MSTPDQGDLSAIAEALGLPADASRDAVLSQASGLVGAVYELRGKIYRGLLDPILAAHGVDLE
jgi:hypothetical protein